MMMMQIMSLIEWRNRVCWTTREIASSAISPSEPQRAQCVKETSTGFGPRTNAATRHSDNRRRRLTRWPMDRWPKPKNSKVDRANELRGRGHDGDTPSARIRSQPSSLTVGHTHTHTHAAAATRIHWDSQPHTRAHTYCARGASCRFNRSAHTPAALTRKNPAGGLRPKQWGSAPAGTPPSSGRHTAAVPGSQTPSSPIQCER